MKITVITSSPRKKGTSALLADEFIRGAKETGHDIFRFDAAFEKISPCLACDKCSMGSRACVHKDSMEKLNSHLLESDVIVFVTPLYYFGMSAQLKTVIDRFYASNYKLMDSGKKAVLMVTAYDDRDWTMQALVSHYETILKYLKWKNAGMILATACGARTDIERSVYPEKAYELAKNIK